MLRAIQMMMRNEPMTFYVMLMMIAILIFGAWSSWPTAKKSSAFQTGDLLADVFWLLDKFRVWDRRCLLAHSVGFFRLAPHRAPYSNLLNGRTFSGAES